MEDVRKFGNAASSGGGKGVVGRLFGTEFIMSQQAELLDASGSASTDVYQSYVFGPEHFGVSKLYDPKVIIKNPSPSSTLDLYGTVGWKCAFTCKELDSKRMTRIESGATMGD